MKESYNFQGVLRRKND
eukprot:UN04537